MGVGIRGGSRRERLRISIAFPCAEIAMICLGALLGKVVGQLIGDAAGFVGFGALVAVGSYMIIEARSDLADRSPINVTGGWGLLVASLAISLDSLGIGFSILFIGVPVGISLLVIGVVSVIATQLGLQLGRALGTRVEDAAELLGGVLLALTGIVFIVLKVLNIG
ncbi:MAG TPA: manganese efflux pump [Candidatus Aquilonibacter sp.]